VQVNAHSLQQRSIRNQSTSSIVPVQGFFVFHVTVFLSIPSDWNDWRVLRPHPRRGSQLSYEVDPKLKGASDLTYAAGSQIQKAAHVVYRTNDKRTEFLKLH
jgi:hypothetical protein